MSRLECNYGNYNSRILVEMTAEFKKEFPMKFNVDVAKVVSKAVLRVKVWTPLGENDTPPADENEVDAANNVPFYKSAFQNPNHYFPV